ncbi:hypothetical protein BDV36DRAFT_252913 [Aspergillus pseudocaelatus]|uniref:Amino acid permease/ SLC12A domain-containing protein n=1 Tax=Aspergillus pseudocaelatus TaxID=1825620 RepID=A0ABQ6WTH1_9EURO|nr:hypothetical protein BDV36DRAFT_252913 [Aspergillus pseudocaelatus]
MPCYILNRLSLGIPFGGVSSNLTGVALIFALFSLLFIIILSSCLSTLLPSIHHSLKIWFH